MVVGSSLGSAALLSIASIVTTLLIVATVGESSAVSIPAGFAAVGSAAALSDASSSVLSASDAGSGTAVALSIVEAAMALSAAGSAGSLAVVTTSTVVGSMAAMVVVGSTIGTEHVHTFWCICYSNRQGGMYDLKINIAYEYKMEIEGVSRVCQHGHMDLLTGKASNN